MLSPNTQIAEQRGAVEGETAAARASKKNTSCVRIQRPKLLSKGKDNKINGKNKLYFSSTQCIEHTTTDVVWNTIHETSSINKTNQLFKAVQSCSKRFFLLLQNKWPFEFRSLQFISSNRSFEFLRSFRLRTSGERKTNGDK